MTGLPDPEPGTVFIVARMVAEARPGRTDLVFVHRAVRDDRGRVVGATALARAATAPTHLLVQDVEGGVTDDGGDGIVASVYRVPAGPTSLAQVARVGELVGTFAAPFAHLGDGAHALATIDAEIRSRLGLVVATDTPLYERGHYRVYPMTRP